MNDSYNQQQPGYYPHSAAYQMRDNLLRSNIGDIDVSQEVPINLPSQSHSTPNMLASNQNQTSQLQNQQQYNKFHSYSQVNMSSGNISNRNNFGNIRSHFQHRYSGVPSGESNHNTAPHRQEKKAYSLTQKSITNFFRVRSKRPNSSGSGKGPVGRSGGGGNGSGGDKDDDDEEVVLDNGPTSNLTMTFQDITTFGYKQGDKFGVSSDTTPIIPTLMTTSQVKNMNNTEYRKYMTTQKKLALSAAAGQQQQQQQQQQNNGMGNEGPRTMSLQSNFARNPYGANPNLGRTNIKNGQSNVMGTMGGAPAPSGGNMQMRNQQYWNQGQQIQQQYYQQSNGMGSEGPRTMSLTTGPPQFSGNVQRYNATNYSGTALPGQQQQQWQQQQQYSQPVDHRFRTLSLQGPGPGSNQLNQRVAGPGALAHGNPTNNENRNWVESSQPGAMLSGRNGPQAQIEHTVDRRERGPYEVPSYRHSTNALPSYDNGIGGGGDGATVPNTQMSAAGGIPGNIGNNGLGPYQKRDSISQQQQQQQEQQQQQRSQVEISKPAGKLNILQLSTQQQRELDQGKYFEQHVQTNNLKDNEQPTIDLRPRSALESGLQSLSLDNDTNHNLKESNTKPGLNKVSEVKEARTLQGGIYKLEASCDSSDFATASDFHDDDRSRSNLGNLSPRYKNHGLRPTSKVGPERRSEGENSEETVKVEKDINDRSQVAGHPHTSGPPVGDVKSEISEISGTIDDTFGYKNSKVKGRSTSSSEGGVQNEVIPKENNVMVNKLPESNVADERGRGEDEFNFDNTVVKPYTDSLGRDIKGLDITGEHLGLLNENKSLMQDLTLVSMELAESLKRETLLSEQLRNSNASNGSYEKKNQISLADFSEELRKKSSKVVELIQALNEERLKRFIAEEQVLLQENNAKPNTLELMNEIHMLRTTVREKESEISKLKEELAAARR